MDDNVINDNFMDDLDSEVQPALKCDVEIDNSSGRTLEEINKSTADALRSIASQIESDSLDTGFHPITTPSGEKIGQVYLDYYGTI
jgi:hypothetical protein